MTGFGANLGGMASTTHFAQYRETFFLHFGQGQRGQLAKPRGGKEKRCDSKGSFPNLHRQNKRASHKSQLENTYTALGILYQDRFCLSLKSWIRRRILSERTKLGEVEMVCGVTGEPCIFGKEGFARHQGV